MAYSSAFHFKQFSIAQNKCAMKVGTDGVLLGAWADVENAKTILDIGTGTGVIALMLAQRSNALVDAIDIDELSCFQARENISRSKFNGRINVEHCSLQKFSAQNKKRYDLIVSNPPYYSNALKSNNLHRNLARHSDFTEIHSEILLDSVINLLNAHGKFCVIFPERETNDLMCAAEKKQLFCTKLTRIYSKPGKKCIRLLMQFELEKREMETTILTIETGEKPNDFNASYKNLTKDFYLAF